MLLGFWQLNRASQKATLIADFALRQTTAPLNAHDLTTQSAPTTLRYRPVAFQGATLNAFPILLENVFQNNQLGYRWYHLVSLNDKQVILTEGDWVLSGPSRDVLPPKPADLKTRFVTGYLEQPYRNPFMRKAIESDKITWPLRMQTLDLTLLSQLIGKEVYPMIIVSKTPTAKNFPVPPERHRAYATQWFGLAGACFIVSLCVYRSHREKKR